MEKEITGMIDDFEEGRLTRRQIIARLMALSAAVIGMQSTAGAEDESGSTFEGTDINHIALNVTDVSRSRDWYVKHLGLEVTRDSANSCFLNCTRNNFVALFRSGEPGLNHYCYSIPDYNPDAVVEKLKGVGISSRREDNRIYFPDPDGITIQLAAR